MRVLLTGSRDWTDVDEIHDALDALYLLWKEESVEPAFTLVHGACPTGADNIANEWARATHGVVIERHPYWERYGNRHMVELGADHFLAFIKDNSAGAAGCLRLAWSEKLPNIQVFHRGWYTGWSPKQQWQQSSPSTSACSPSHT